MTLGAELAAAEAYNTGAESGGCRLQWMLLATASLLQDLGGDLQVQ